MAFCLSCCFCLSLSSMRSKSCLFCRSSRSYFSVSRRTMVSQSSVALLVSWSPSMASKSNGLIRMDKEIFFSSSNCSLVLVISRRASCTLPIPLSVFFGSLASCLLLFLLCLHHGLSLLFCFFQAFSLLFSLFGFFVGFLLPCFSFSLLSSSSSLDLCFLHSLIYSRSCSSNSPFLASCLAFKKFPSPFLEVLEVTSSSS